jgi:hypothetical protein
VTEIVVRPPSPRGSSRLIRLLALVAGLALVVAGLVFALRPHGVRERAQVAQLHVKAAHTSARPAARTSATSPHALATISGAIAASAARSFDRGFFLSSPGGLAATAARVARWRPLIRRATRGSDVGPNLLEALVFVESGGRPDAIGGGDVAARVGLTQIGASTGKRLLRLHVNTRRSRALTRRIERADARGAYVTARQLRHWRARYDERFSPAKSLRATVRYLDAAQAYLGRDDLAVAAYRLGIRKLQNVVRIYGGEAPSYAQLYFGSSPREHRGAWRRLAAAGEPARDYLWKVLAAKRIMRVYRVDRSALRYEGSLQARKNSSEEVLHPRYRTPRFASPAALARAWRHHVLRAIPRDVRRTHIAVAASLGAEARALGRSRRLYRGLRPAARRVLLYIGREVHALSGARRPLILTSAVRDNRYQRLLMRVNANAARSYSMHTTGYAFDIARVYGSRRQAAAFQFVLDRLVALNAIAYIREAAAIHIAVASDAGRKLAWLSRV